MTITKISNTKFKCIERCEYGTSTIDFEFLLTKNISYRTVTLQLINIVNNSSTSASCSIYYGYSKATTLTTFLSNETVGAISIVNITDKSINLKYTDLGLIQLWLRFDLSTISDTYVNLSDYQELLIDPKYTEPEIEITSVSGIKTYNGVNYINYKSTLNVSYSENSEYNSCDSSISFIGFKYIKSGYPELIKESKSIGDQSNTVSISAILDESEIASYDGSAVYVYAIRQDEKGNYKIDTYYVGTIYIRPKLINYKITLSSDDSSLSYDVSSKGGTCIFFTHNKSLKVKISQDKILGVLSGYQITIKEISEYSSYSYYTNSNIFTGGIFNFSGNYSYLITIIPILKINGNRYSLSTIYNSKQFKVLDYPNYIVTGQDKNYPSGYITPGDCPNYLLNSHNISNPDYKSTLNADTNVSLMIDENQDLSRLSSYSAKILLYGINSEGELKYVTITNYENGKLDFKLLDYQLLSSLRSMKGYEQINNFSLCIAMAGITDNNQIFTMRHYIGKVYYNKDTYININTSFSSENNILYVELEDDNTHQLGITTEYRIKIINMITEECIKDHYTGTLVSGSYFSDLTIYPNTVYRIEAYHVYREGTATFWNYDNPSFIETTFINVDSPGIPEIHYPKVPSSENDIWYSGDLNKGVYVLFKLPELLADSGSATEEDRVYSSIRFSLNNGEYIYSEDGKLTNDTFNLTSISNFKYKGKMSLYIKSSALQEGKNTLKLQVQQNWNNVNEWGTEVLLNFYIYSQDNIDIRNSDYENNIISINRFNDMANVLKGFSKSYLENFKDNYSAMTNNEIIKIEEFVTIYLNYVKALNTLSNWTGLTSSLKSELLTILNVSSIEEITEDLLNNYIQNNSIIYKGNSTKPNFIELGYLFREYTTIIMVIS